MNLLFKRSQKLRLFLISWLILLSAATPLFPQGVKTNNHAYGIETLDSLTLAGSVKLQGTTISNLLKITGNLIAASSILNKVEATGNVELSNTSISGETEIVGSLKASKSNFDKPLFFLGQRAIFSDCRLSDLTVRKDQAFKGRQIVELKNGTKVDGAITFEGEEGKVLLYPGAKLTGKVKGGTLIRKGF